MQSEVTQAPRGGSGEMFDRIAGRYDLLNRVMSLGLDESWRRKLIHAVAAELGEGDELLDLATGTADVAIASALAKPGVRIVGLDPSAGMLDIGRRKITARSLDDRVTLVEGDAQALPFADDRFAGVTMSFGIRNVPDRGLALSEMARVVRPGGHVGILELTEPRRGVLAALARVHIHRVIPAIGGWLSGDAEYRYLARSIAAFPAPAEFAALMRDRGLSDVRATPLCFGSVHLFTATVR